MCNKRSIEVLDRINNEIKMGPTIESNRKYEKNTNKCIGATLNQKIFIPKISNIESFSYSFFIIKFV